MATEALEVVLLELLELLVHTLDLIDSPFEEEFFVLLLGNNPKGFTGFLGGG
jgi:hypothetical protein